MYPLININNFDMIILFAACLWIIIASKEFHNYRKMPKINIESIIEFQDESLLDFNNFIITEELQPNYPRKINKITLFYPSGIWLPEENKYLVVVRVLVNGWTSYLYISFFDSNLNQITSKANFKSVEVPSTLKIYNHDVECAIEFSGPEDPRIYKAPNSEIMILFNQLNRDGNRIMRLISLENSEIFVLTLSSYPISNQLTTPIKLPIEKNWTPLVTETEVFYLYSLTPQFQTIKCRKIGVCDHYQSKYSSKIGQFKTSSPFYHITNNYFMSFSYRQFHIEGGIYYRPSITFIKYKNIQGKAQFSYEYTSEMFLNTFDKFAYYPYTNENLVDFRNLPMKNRKLIFIVSSILNFDLKNDETLISGFAEDKIVFKGKIKGIKKIFDIFRENYEGFYYKITA